MTKIQPGIGWKWKYIQLPTFNLQPTKKLENISTGIINFCEKEIHRSAVCYIQIKFLALIKNFKLQIPAGS
jgi:hypothetical protein